MEKKKNKKKTFPARFRIAPMQAAILLSMQEARRFF